MDTSMFSPANSGYRLAQQDKMAQQLQAMALQQHAAQMELTQVETQGKLQDMGKKQQDQANLQSQQQMMQQLMQQQKAQQDPNTPENIDKGEKLTNKLFDASEMLFASGDIEGGKKMLDAASQSGQHIATAQHQKALTEQNKLNQAAASPALLAKLLQGVDNEEDFRGALSQYSKLPGVTPLPLRLQSTPYTPELVELLQRKALSAQDTIKEEARDRRLDLAEKREEQKIKMDGARLALSRAEFDNLKRHQDVTEKTGGAKAPKITTTDIKMGIDLIINRFPKVTKDTPGVYAEASVIAQQADDILRNDKSTTKSQAMNLAFNRAMERGDIKSAMETTPTLWGFGPDKVKEKIEITPGEGGKVVKPALAVPPNKAEASPESTKALVLPKIPPPIVGSIMRGYRFKGGDPADKNNWEKQ